MTLIHEHGNHDTCMKVLCTNPECRIYIASPRRLPNLLTRYFKPEDFCITHKGANVIQLLANFMTIRPQEKCVLNANSLIKRDMFQLIFEGTRGWTSASDIGIDDIVYTHGWACPDAPTPVPGVTDDFYCGFEDEDSQCGLLKNVSSANRDWYIMWKSEFILLIHYLFIDSFLSIYI